MEISGKNSPFLLVMMHHIISLNRDCILCIFPANFVKGYEKKIPKNYQIIGGN